MDLHKLWCVGLVVRIVPEEHRVYPVLALSRNVSNDLCVSFDLDDQLRTWTDGDMICSVEDEVLLLPESKV